MIVTVTGAPHVITHADLGNLRDGVVLISAGHLPWELDVPSLIEDPSVESIDDVTEGITTLRLRDGRAVHILTRGHMVNLAGPRPLGNSIESMDLGFTLQARCLEAVARGCSAEDRVRRRRSRRRSMPSWRPRMSPSPGPDLGPNG